MLPFTTPLSHSGDELVGTLLFRPEVPQQAIEVTHSGNPLLRCKYLQVCIAIKKTGSLPHSFLPLHIAIEHFDIFDLEAQNFSLGLRGLPPSRV